MIAALEKIKGKIEITYNDVFLFDNIFFILMLNEKMMDLKNPPIKKVKF